MLTLPPALGAIQDDESRQRLEWLLDGYGEAMLTWHVVNNVTNEPHYFHDPMTGVTSNVAPHVSYVDAYGDRVDRQAVMIMTSDLLAYVDASEHYSEMWINRAELNEMHGWLSIGYALAMARNGMNGVRGTDDVSVMLNGAMAAMGPATLRWVPAADHHPAKIVHS